MQQSSLIHYVVSDTNLTNLHSALSLGACVHIDYVGRWMWLAWSSYLSLSLAIQVGS